MKRNNKKNLCDVVTAQLLEMIENGSFKPGDQLPNEIELSEQLGVSRTTLREAKSNLVAMNILTKHRGRGTFVVDKQMAPLQKQQLDKLNYDHSRLADLFEIRQILEPNIAMLAAQKAAGSKLRGIQSNMFP